MSQRQQSAFIVQLPDSFRAFGLAAALLVSCWLADVGRAASAELDRAKLFDTVVETVERRFVDPERLKQIDWRIRADAVRPTVLAAPTTGDAVLQINRLLAELRWSHTGLYSPDDYFYYSLLDIVGINVGDTDLMARRFWGTGPYYPGTGAFTRIVEGRHFIDAVLDGSPADRAGLRYGDEIVAVDGTPYSPVAAFHGKVGTTVAVTIRRHAGAELLEVPVDVLPLHPIKAFGEATVASARVVERGGKRIGYIHVWASAESESFRKALSRLDPKNMLRERLESAGLKVRFEEGSSRSTSAAPKLRPNIVTPSIVPNAGVELPKPIDFLIVDMRGKIGGYINVATEHLKTLDARTEWAGYAWTSGASAPSGTPSPGSSYRGRAALLISGDTRSTAERMADGFKRGRFGPVLGTNSAGASVASSTFAMPGDLLLHLAVANSEVGGRRLEGVGVAPDHQVERPLLYAAGADPVLEAALDLLAAQPPKQ